MTEIQSPIFGTVKLLDDEKAKEMLKTLINDYPVDVFSLLNKKLNSLGYLIGIGKL